MPLQLGGVETERPKLITWDTECSTQSKEAQEEIQRLKKQGFKTNTVESGWVQMSPPPKPANLGVMRILSKNGDDRLTWDRGNPGEIKDAYKKFKDFVKKGYQAFAVMATGGKGHKLDDFDPLMEEIIMVPGTVPG